MTRTAIFFYDKDFNYLGSKDVTGAPVTWLDGTQDTVGLTYPIYAFNGKLFTAGDTHYSTDPSVDRRTRLIYSEDGGDSWKEAKDDSLYNVFAIGGFHFFSYNNCVIIQNTDSFYMSYNGGSDFQYIDIDPEGFGNWNGSTPFVIDADKHYKDIIVPLSYGYGYLAIERIRQYNVAKPQPPRIRTSEPANPVDGDIWID